MQDLDETRPSFAYGADVIYNGFFQLLEFAGMDAIPVLRYEPVTCWLNENQITRDRERDEIRYLLSEMLSTYRKFREEHKPDNA